MSDLFDLSGQVALVTGTSRGLGQYFARALARAGADIAMTSRDKNSLAAFAEEIEALGRKPFCADLDVRDHASIQRAIAADAKPLRQDRHPREQCRLQHPQARARRHVGRLEHRFSTPICAARSLWRRPLRAA